MNDGQQYRDRAKERRAKYGEADKPKPNKLKEKYMRAMQEVESKGLPEKNIGSDNIGSKMLQRMGWKEGLGLGKTNQGRTDIVEVSMLPYILMFKRHILFCDNFYIFLHIDNNNF